jgi:polyisoprenyl-phosphate glycosyltransferase
VPETTLSARQVDIIVPVYNEEEVIGAFHRQLSEVISALPYQFTIHYINDGSSDASQVRLEEIAAGDPRVMVTEFSRNFGKEAALTAGFDQAHADYVVSLDSDGQHPPMMIAEMLEMADSGFELILTQRVYGKDVSEFKRESSALFYRLINRISDTNILPNVTDFCLLTRPVVEALRGMREYSRFMRGMVAWLGYRTVVLSIQSPERLGGTSKFSTYKLAQLAIKAMVSYSLLPLYVIMLAGMVLLGVAALEGLYALILWATVGLSALLLGWASLLFVILGVGGLLLSSLGLVGIYVGIAVQESKRRPQYLVRRRLGKDDGAL